MKGLITKDLFISKSSLPFLLIGTLMMGIGMSILASPYVVIPISVIMFSSVAASTINSDKTSSWDKVEYTMPLALKNVVCAKFVLHILVLVLSYLISLLIAIIVSSLQYSLIAEKIVLFSMIGLVAGLVSGSINIPCSYKFEPDKVMIIMLCSYLFSFIGMGGVGLFLNVFVPIDGNIYLFSILMLCLASALLYGSYLLTLRIKRKGV